MDSPNSIDSRSSEADNLSYSAYFSQLLETKLYVDVTFILEIENGKVEVHAHQLILAMRSTYYADLFYLNGKGRKIKQNQEIRLEKMNPKAFGDMIRFCYDCKPELETLQEAYTLIRIASQFKVMGLVDLCRTRMSEVVVNSKNIFHMLEISELMEDKTLTNACRKFLEENTASVLESYEMAQVTPSMVRSVLGLPKLALNSEFELINWIMDWAHAKAEEDVCKSSRDYLKDFLPDMNFLALDCEKFATLCKDYPDIFSSDEINSIYLNITHPEIKEMPDWHKKEMRAREYTGQDLRSKFKKQLFTCLGTIGQAWESWKESIKCFLEENKNFENEVLDVVERFLLCYILCTYCHLCHSVLMKILKIEEKDGKLSNWRTDVIKFQEIMQYLQRMLTLLEVGADPDNCCIKEIENMLQDDVFERMKQENTNENRSEKFKELLQGTEKYQRMRTVLRNFEESGILRTLDDLYEMNKIFHESEKLNIHFMVIERTKRIRNDCIELMIELKNIICRLNVY